MRIAIPASFMEIAGGQMSKLNLHAIRWDESMGNAIWDLASDLLAENPEDPPTHGRSLTILLYDKIFRSLGETKIRRVDQFQLLLTLERR